MEYEHGREQFFRKEQINNLTNCLKKKKSPDSCTEKCKWKKLGRRFLQICLSSYFTLKRQPGI